MLNIVATGGHHTSTLTTLDQLSKELDAKNIQYKFTWIGKKYLGDDEQKLTPEYLDVQKRNIEFFHLKTGKLYRTHSLKYIFNVIENLLIIPVGFINAYKLLNRIKPDLVLSFGGYLAVPVAVVAKLMGAKVLTHEQTVTFGIATKIIGMFADKIYVSWKDVDYPASYKSKIVYTGLPIRIIPSEGSKVAFADNKPVLYVSGGKLGSDTINNVVFKSLDNLLEQVNLIWSIGAYQKTFKQSDLVEYIKNNKAENKIHYADYFNEEGVAENFRTFDLALSRAGAHTVYEYALYAKPAILVPIPWASNNEQYKNAEVLKDLNLCEIINQDEFTPELLIRTLKMMLDNIQKNTYPNIVDIEKDGTNKICSEILKEISNS